MNAIELRDVTKIYEKSHLGKKKTFKGVEKLNLAVAQGEVYGLLGLNGSGKTTTIKMMLGLLYPTKGAVEVLGRQMPDMDVLKKVGYLPEAAYLNKFLTGRETVELFLRLSGKSGVDFKKTVDETIEKVGMLKFADRRLSEYSKGMLQRISIAQALSHDPDVLIFDEPITGLDPLALKEIRQLIIWLKSKNKTVFFSSHNISEVEKVCDRIGILVNGELVKTAVNGEWAQEGALENMFIETVKNSDRVGELKFIV